MNVNLSRAAIVLSACLFVAPSWSDEMVTDAAIGGGIGGAVGGAVGAEVGGREGAIVGAGVGAAAGAAIATDEHAQPQRQPPANVAVVTVHPEARFCPPGQAKKGRC
jgi:hypothetical protein